jgi:hypothetical protein
MITAVGQPRSGYLPGSYADAAMAAEARQQLDDLDALAPYATQLSHDRFGRPIDEQERLLAALRGMVTVPAAPESVRSLDLRDRSLSGPKGSR